MYHDEFSRNKIFDFEIRLHMNRYVDNNILLINLLLWSAQNFCIYFGEQGEYSQFLTNEMQQ